MCLSKVILSLVFFSWVSINSITFSTCPCWILYAQRFIYFIDTLSFYMFSLNIEITFKFQDHCWLFYQAGPDIQFQRYHFRWMPVVGCVHPRCRCSLLLWFYSATKQIFIKNSPGCCASLVTVCLSGHCTAFIPTNTTSTEAIPGGCVAEDLHKEHLPIPWILL